DNYRLYCVQCHGSKGTGEGINNTMGGLAVSPKNHASAEEMSKLSDEDIRLAITEGGDAVSKSELMPAWGDTLATGEIDQLVSYLRQLCKCEGGR
ncbi:MAG: c-type cytochrome, partial [Acidiferrobacterales bacterium]